MGLIMNCHRAWIALPIETKADNLNMELTRCPLTIHLSPQGEKLRADKEYIHIYIYIYGERESERPEWGYLTDEKNDTWKP